MRREYETKYDIVADLYDVYVDDVRDIPFWLKEAAKESEVLELTAGTGRVTMPLSRAGVKMTAVDASSAMLKILRERARKEKLSISIHRADIRSFDLHKRFPLVIIPFNSIQEIVDSEDHKLVFLQVGKHLRKGGRFIVTTHNSNLSRDSRRDIRSPVREYVNPRNGRRIRFSSKGTVDARTHIAISYQRYEECDKKGRVLGEKLFKNRYYVFDKDEFEGIIQSTGFRIKNLYGDYSYSKFSRHSPFRIYELVRKVDGRTPSPV